jgi:hypothetical protein
MQSYLASEEGDRVNVFYLRGDVAHASPQAFITRTAIHIPPQEPAARASSTARSDSSISSVADVCFDRPQRRGSSASSDSTAPPTTGAPPWFRSANPTSPDPALYNYDLPCEFSFAGCRVRFAPDNWGYWVSHSLTHFQAAGPPPSAICAFCDDIFEDFADPVLKWQERMIHMGEHFQNGQSPRPDFFLIKYIKVNGSISEEDYAAAMLYTERPKIEYLVSRGYKTKGRIQQDEKNPQEVDDLGKEKRTIRRLKQQTKGKRVDRHS